MRHLSQYYTAILLGRLIMTMVSNSAHPIGSGINGKENWLSL